MQKQGVSEVRLFEIYNKLQMDDTFGNVKLRRHVLTMTSQLLRYYEYNRKV